ncbi:MAG: hypothetical protein EA364_11800 [Balneolaceae bacterium]|nr:MAG: hypothetical protein EA364_11800 [Balneolaceae bacterium]
MGSFDDQATSLLLFAFNLVATYATVEKNLNATSFNKNEEMERAEILLKRLDEIKAMDVSAMSPSQKSELQKEVKTIQNDLRDLSGGVYISATALMIILLLLIVLT